MPFRIQRINSEMQKSLSVTIQTKLKDPRIAGIVGVTKVDCAKDLKTAKVYVSCYGSKEERLKALEAIKSSAGFIRRELASDLKDIRTVPQLTFFADESGEYAGRIDELLAGLNKKE